jgi:hypothetical protein
MPRFQYFKPIESDYTDDGDLETELNSAFATSMWSANFPITAAVCGGLCGSLASCLLQKHFANILPSVAVPIPSFAPFVATFIPLWGAHRYLERTNGSKSHLTYFNTALGIGVVAGCGLIEVAKCGQHLPFGIFACCLGFYHLAEFYLVARYNPSLLSVDSFLGNVDFFLIGGLIHKHSIGFSFFDSQ